MVKLYQMADRFSNKPLLADLGTSIMDFVEHSSCPIRPSLVQLAQLFPDQFHMSTHYMNNPTTLAELFWWTNTYRDTYNALDRKKTDQDDMRTRLVEIFCRKFPDKNAIAIAPITSESRDFIQAVFSYVAHKNSDLKTQKQTLAQELKALEKLNETDGSHMAELRCPVHGLETEINHLRTQTRDWPGSPSYSSRYQEENHDEYGSTMSDDNDSIGGYGYNEYGSDSDMNDD
ncbi:hypothetical protein CSPAE12_05082 [Colletotrichum incanum]|nr:hypothetical protein CSPAE12_05082 [Colletotrichum incanum]